jgi:CheY-like chemotaxis protein
MLTVIQGHASIHLAAAHLEKGVADSLSQVSLAADRAAALTRQLLTFSRKQIVQPEVLDLNGVVSNMHGMLHRLIGEHIDLRHELAPALPSIFADQSNMEQVIANLVVNARDAMPHGGQVVIRTSTVALGAAEALRHPQARVGKFVCLAVQDKGCGMDAVTLSHIFEPFFTTKEVGKGTGLGLATVYGIVAGQDGWIEVSSAVGHGTEFRIFLPLSDRVRAVPGEVDSGAIRGGNETVLVVEDEPAVREIMTDILRQHGYRVLEAGDGTEATDVWKRHSHEIDILVTDIVMPNGPKGNVIAERFVAERPDLKVIFSTGYSSEFATAASPLDERFDCLEKPYKPELLARTVRACLDR